MVRKMDSVLRLRTTSSCKYSTPYYWPARRPPRSERGIGGLRSHREARPKTTTGTDKNGVETFQTRKAPVSGQLYFFEMVIQLGRDLRDWIQSRN